MVNKGTATTNPNNAHDVLKGSLKEAIKSVKDPMKHILNYIIFEPNGEYTKNYTDIDVKTGEHLGDSDECHFYVKRPINK